MKTMKKMGLLWWIMTIAVSQDIHFSMPDSWTHSSLLPLTGYMKNTYRFVGGYRSQWGSYLNPYLTYGLAADMKINNFNIGWMGFGIRMLKDNALLLIPKTQIGISSAFHIEGVNGNILSFALGVDYYSIKFIPENLITEMQITERGPDLSLPSGESFITDNLQYVALGGGLMGTLFLTPQWVMIGGFDLTYLNSIKEAFTENKNYKKGIRIRLMLLTEIQLTYMNKLRIVGFLQQIRGAFELNSGFIMQHKISSQFVGSKEVVLGGGIWLRAVRNISPMITISWHIFTFSISYDIQIFNTNRDIGPKGGVETILRIGIPFSSYYSKGIMNCPRL